MDPVYTKPLQKKSKSDDSRCCNCNIIFRRGKVTKAKVFADRVSAAAFCKQYDFYVEVGDIICKSCFTKLRCTQSKCRAHKPGKAIDSVTENSSSQKMHHKDSEGELSHSLCPTAFQCIPKPSSSKNIEPFNELLLQKQFKCSQDSSIGEKTFARLGSSSSSQTLIRNLSISSSEPKTESESAYSEWLPDEEKTRVIESTVMSFPRVCYSKKYCFICKSQEDIHDVPFEARLQVFVKRRLFIPKRNRCCSKHLIKQRFYESEIDTMVIFSDECVIDSEEIKKFLNQLSEDVEARLHDKIGECSISDERIKALTGHTWDTIIRIRDMMKTMKNSKNRNITQAIVLFLLKLKSGNSDNLIAAIMDIKEFIVRDSISAVLKAFRKHVLPKNFGISAYSRQFFLQQTSRTASLLHNLQNSLAIICDGTYLRHEKSSNNIYQRKSYSLQKKTCLCKPFTICTTNGYIIELAGPFDGKMNDAEILQHLMRDQNGLLSILKKGDVFFLDRGFRDIKHDLENAGYKVLMPPLKGKRKQLTAEESNHSRFVTKIRWVVEAIHGAIGQKYKLLHHQFRNCLLKDAEVYCKVACLLHNLTGKRLNSDGEKLNAIVDRMKLKISEDNELAKKVASSNWDRKTAPFRVITSSDLLDFPELDLDDLEYFCTGSYQLSQAVSYLGEMLEEDGSLILSYVMAEPYIVRFEVKSRHISSKTYKCYIQYFPDSYGIDAINGYCCNCANGLRTIGCCSHIAALVYHLSYGRYLSRIIRPAEVLSKLFTSDNICPVIDEDSDED